MLLDLALFLLERLAAPRRNSREYNRDGGNSLQSAECIGLAQGGGGMTADGYSVKSMKVPITTFEKIACEKAQGKVGYLCDCAMGYDTSNSNNIAAQYRRQRMTTQACLVQ